MALGLVLMIGIIVLVLGFAMITTSGGLLANSVDSKQRIKSRIAAESQANMMMAAAVEKASSILGGNMALPNMTLKPLPTHDGTKASATASLVTGPNGSLPQERLTEGAFRGMNGYRVEYKIQSEGVAPGGARTRIDASIWMHQVPIFQFGVFYEGNLEICPGRNMTVLGPVHTNGSAFFRSPQTLNDRLHFQGPITAVGTVYHWSGSTMLNCPITYLYSPEVGNSAHLENYPSALSDRISPMTSFPDVRGISNVRWGVERLKLPIDGSLPRDILMPMDPSDPPGLRRQKFDSLAQTKCTNCSNRWINGVSTARPAWITGPRVFYDRREKAWVKFWDFSVKDITSNDSIFYLADLVVMDKDRGSRGDTVINAFRIVNASKLPRNMTIATPNPVYIVGNFNAPNPTGRCRPAEMTGTVPDSLKYCNAMIASDALTLVSSLWTANDFATRGMFGTLERDFADPYWTPVKSMSGQRAILTPEPQSGTSHWVPPTNIIVNAAIMTGNKVSAPAALPPANFSNGVFENNYEGGWHNTIRFLEDLTGDTVTFNGSFVCMWSAATPGLNQGPGKVIQTLPGGYYLPPERRWSFDTRFRQLANMPPATPFLATAPNTSFSEVR